MNRCSYIFKNANKDYKQGEQCRIYPKNGKFCYKHSKSAQNKPGQTMNSMKELARKKIVEREKKIPTSKTTGDQSLGKRGFSAVETPEEDESSMGTAFMKFADDDEAKELRKKYANRKGSQPTEDELTDTESEGELDEGPILNGKGTGKVTVVDSDGEECEMSDDGEGEDTGPSFWGPQDDPLHPVTLAKVGAIEVLNWIETIGEVPGYTERVVNIPAWIYALEKVLQEYIKDASSIKPEYVLIGVPLAIFIHMRYSKKLIAPDTQQTSNHNGSTQHRSSSELGGSEELSVA